MESHAQHSSGGQPNHKSRTPRGSILKLGGAQGAADHVKFDEETIMEHDKDRGTRQKITEPKTPYEEMVQQDQEMSQEAQSDVEMQNPVNQEIDEEIKQHLAEAERNKMLNAQLLHQQAEAQGAHLNMHQFHKELAEKLDQTQISQDDAEKSKQTNHLYSDMAKYQLNNLLPSIYIMIYRASIIYADEEAAL